MACTAVGSIAPTSLWPSNSRTSEQTQIDGREAANPSGQYEDSSITQLVAGYSFTPRFALQVNVPLVYRSFERPEGFALDRGTEAGLGDISLLGKLVIFHKEAGGGRAV